MNQSLDTISPSFHHVPPNFEAEIPRAHLVSIATLAENEQLRVISWRATGEPMEIPKVTHKIIDGAQLYHLGGVLRRGRFIMGCHGVS